MKSGFSLLELSIVLVIIGLIAGGITAGSSMIRSAELRSVMTEQEQYKTAVYTFRDKYLGLPGDIKNADAFWGARDAGDGLGVDCTDVSATNALTCNGNSNGQIEEIFREPFLFWQHLANAELISGSFTGAPGPGDNDHHLLDINAPQSKLSAAGWFIHYDAGGSDSNMMRIGAEEANDSFNSPVFTPEEVWNIDKKIDDGMPTTGRVTHAHAACISGTEYNLANTDIACAINFIKYF